MKIVLNVDPKNQSDTPPAKNPEGNNGRGARIRLKPLKKSMDVSKDVPVLLYGVLRITKGGPGSGDWGHRGRPGKVGGSAEAGGFVYTIDGQEGTTRHTISRADITKRRTDRKANVIPVNGYNAITQKLKNSVVNDRKAIDGGMSETFVGEIDGVGKVIDKPINSLYYYSGEMYKSEIYGAEFPVAAGDIAANFGWDEVPPSEISKDGTDLRSVFKDNTSIYISVESEVKADKGYIDSLERLAVIDHIIGQQDGHQQNYVVDKNSKKVFGIDYNIAGFGRDRRVNQVPENALTWYADRSRNGDRGYNQTPLRKEFVTKFLSSVITLKFSSSVPKDLQVKLQQRYDKLVAAMSDKKNYSYDTDNYFLMDRSY